PVAEESGGGGISLPNLPIPIDRGGRHRNIKAVLESDYLMEKVVKDLRLLDEILGENSKKFKDPYRVAAAGLKGSVKVVETPKIGAIRIKVDWKDPQTAQKINQSVIENLREILNEKAFTVAKMNRVIYEKELQKVEEELKKAIAEVNTFQRERGIILPENRLQAQMVLYASLLSEKLRLEEQLRSYSTVYSENHPTIKQTRERLSYVNGRLLELEGKINSGSPTATEKTLEVLPEYAPLQAKVQQLKAKYEVVARLLEQSKMQEAKESLFVEVIDPPSYPEFPSKPKKKLIVASAFVGSFMLAIFVSLIKRAIKSRKERESLAIG
ncbi:MAG: hypothetical protein N3C57_02150, partial [Aquificaceae bacterium]|nr:hypothetical protein [Aquificaceae bacterium]